MICDSSASRLDQEWLRARAEKERQEAKRRRQVYLAGREPISAEGKVAIIVDDGVATGLTILLAIMVLKSRHPKKIVVAVPVSSPDAAARIRAEADELVALDVPQYFMAVGEHYEQFPQLSDEDVIRYMNQQRT
jgi:predicted phosphoribosyltransferase